MRHIVFAVFGGQGEADAAIAEVLREGEAEREQISILARHDAASSQALDQLVQHESGSEDSDARRGLVTGVTLGAVVGGALGTLLAGPFGLLGGGAVAGLVFGAGAGTLHGALAAGLIGAGLTDHSLKRLAERLHAGDVLVTIRTPDVESERLVARVLQRHGARIAEKSVV